MVKSAFEESYPNRPYFHQPHGSKPEFKEGSSEERGGKNEPFKQGRKIHPDSFIRCRWVEVYLEGASVWKRGAERNECPCWLRK